MSASHLVQILLPKETGSGEPISQEWFEKLLKELMRKFGGVTSFLRAPGEGLWRDGSAIERDNIAVVEVMTERLDTEFWRALRKRLEAELRQEEIIIRAQQIVQL
ncbi:hypothetical protein NB311A_13186 [Nitrobacter sp. Nb-311A]|uniref:hypothetical protein n=1 Tax=Nitrobacter sp. Nb-311A TaxID=314253 RepID=UPI00006849D4|nr:hypothetical protein [Nitrobacter sp. Nb-311A]EAQ35272.1 hypothetical protein NB311A_13186 [Nitrobacter sp. Nb-311A]